VRACALTEMEFAGGILLLIRSFFLAFYHGLQNENVEEKAGP
jgi:hypothetical protein